ncbi:hypothetical protein RB595_006159 [Gaeumannomyces hyphopodioides]
MSSRGRKRTRELQPVHLGIDHGTTFTRVRLLLKGQDTKPETVSESFGVRNEFDSRHRIRGSQTIPDFPAFCLPGHSGKETLPSFEIQQSPNRVPLKLASLILDDQDDTETGEPRHALLRLMPRHHQNLVRFKEKDPDNFNDRLMKTWTDHFEHIKSRVLSYCEENEYELTSITMTVLNWANDEKVDHIYSGIIHGVFDGHVSASQFFDVSEAQAMARSLIKEQLSRENSQLAKLVGQRNMLLVVDIGGTAMNGCLVEISRNKDTVLTAIELESFGCFGGSEMWEMAVAEALSKHDPRARDDNVLSAYLSDFADSKAVIQSPDATIRLNHKGDATELIPSEARSCFDKAFKKALVHLELRLREIVSRLAKVDCLQNLAMVFTGGTFNTHCIYMHVSSLVSALDPDGKTAPIFLNQLKNTHIVDPTGLIARGAVYAANTSMTVREFLKEGAAFGVQSCFTKNGLWCNEFPALTSGLVESGESGNYPGRKLGRGGRFEKIALKVVCDPLHGYGRHAVETLSYLNCYDVFVVDEEETQTPGSYRWYLSVWGGSGRDLACGLTLTIEYVQGEWKDGAEQRGFRKEWRIPLRYDIGTGCALPNEAKVEQGEWDLFYT